MKTKKIVSLCIVLFSVLYFSCRVYGIEVLAYTLRDTSPDMYVDGKNVLNRIQDHAHAIQIVVSQAYQIDQDGILWGSINPVLVKIAKQHGIKIMALVTNADYDQYKTRQFLNNSQAQTRAINSLLQACQTQQLDGVQIDFENVRFTDRDVLTHFYQQLANVMHQHKLMVSIAMVPRVADGSSFFPSNFLKLQFENWSGVFDYKALGDSSDFVTLMAYDQHTGDTPPGPIASLPWDEAIIKYALKYIPAHKIFLGIPVYSGYWRIAGSEHDLKSGADQISYQEAKSLLKNVNASLHWNATEKVHYAMFERNYLNEYLFMEDESSFREKLNLAKKYHLQGIAIWRLGMEDPGIWNLLSPIPNSKKNIHHQ